MTSTPEKRPILKIKLTRTDYFLEFLAITCLLASWILPSVVYQSLPDTIPTHFGSKGEIDGWENKASIFIVPVINTLLIIGLSILNRFPHIFNYPVKVTEENALQLYTKSTLLIRAVKVMIALLFFVIEWQICMVNENSKLPAWFLPVIIIIPVVLPIIMAFALTKNPSNGKT